MAGAKGKSGGARPNSGGKRPGAGRKPAPKVLLPDPAKPAAEVADEVVDPVRVDSDDPEVFLLAVMHSVGTDGKLRVEAAKTLCLMKRARMTGAGKKGEQAERAKEVSKGKFAPSAPPKLVVDNMAPK